jgi:hypothetical protein
VQALNATGSAAMSSAGWAEDNEAMTSPFQPGQVPGATPGTPAASRRAPGLPTPPKGWPVGSYPTYAEAQRAVDYLSEQAFPVQQVTIVGVDLMQVERVTGRLTWPKVLGGGVLTGAWLGLFIGLVLGFFSPNPWGALTTGLVAGVFFGLISSAVPYAMARGTRDFSSTMQLVAGRYDVLCDPQNAERARDLLARLAI